MKKLTLTLLLVAFGLAGFACTKVQETVSTEPAVDAAAAPAAEQAPVAEPTEK
ncbi:MAG: hypothetical protein Q7S00_01280 [bacterium]|nr:hypothetical protein [bacterium]